MTFAELSEYTASVVVERVELMVKLECLESFLLSKDDSGWWCVREMHDTQGVWWSGPFGSRAEAVCDLHRRVMCDGVSSSGEKTGPG